MNLHSALRVMFVAVAVATISVAVAPELARAQGGPILERGTQLISGMVGQQSFDLASSSRSLAWRSTTS